MKALFRRKSVSESSSDPSRPKSKSTAPPPLPTSSQPQSGSGFSNTLPRSFNDSNSASASASHSNTHLDPSIPAKSQTSSILPQVSLNRFSGAPLANFTLPSDADDEQEENSQQLKSDLSTPEGLQTEAFDTPMSEVPREIIPFLNSASIKSPDSAEQPPRKSPTASVILATSSPPSDSNAPVPGPVPRKSFDPATHPSKGRPDSLGPDSYFGSIGTPVQHALAQSNSTSQFSELESPQFLPVKVGGVGRVPSEEQKMGKVEIQDGREDGREVALRPLRSTDRSKSEVVPQGSQSRSSSKNRKEKERISKRPSLNNLQSPSQSVPSKREPMPTSSLFTQGQAQPQTKSQSQTTFEESAGSPELKKRSSGFFSMMRRNTKRKSQIDMKQDESFPAKEPLSASPGSASTKMRSNGKTKPMPASAPTPPLPSASIAIQPSPLPRSTNAGALHSNQIEQKPFDLGSKQDSSVDSADSSQNVSDSLQSDEARERSASGRSESGAGSSHGGPSTPLDGTPLIGMSNEFEHHDRGPSLAGLSPSSSSRSNAKSHPPRSATLDESSAINRDQSKINEKLKSIVQRTSSQTGIRNLQQPLLPDLQNDTALARQQGRHDPPAPSSTQTEVILEPRAPPDPDPTNSNRPSRQAESEQFRNSIAHSKSSSVDRNEVGDGAKKQSEELERARDGERPSSRFDMVVNSAPARTSSDVNRQLEVTASCLNEDDGDSERIQTDQKEPDASHQTRTSVTTSKRNGNPPGQGGSSAHQSHLNPTDTGLSWFHYASRSTLPSSLRSSTNHYRTVQETKKVMVPYKKRVKKDSANPSFNPQPQQYELEWRAEIKTELVTYCDLFETVFSRTTEDVLRRLIDGCDAASIKVLRQTSMSLRFCLDNPKGREIVLTKFLGPLGYRRWTGGRFDKSMKDPLPLSCNDLDAFMIGADLTPEYHLVGATYSQSPRALDTRIPLLAKASTRAYNRVLSRLRLQPVFKIPSPPQPLTLNKRSPSSSPSMPSAFRDRSSSSNQIGRANSYYPHQAQIPFETAGSPQLGHNLSPMDAKPSVSIPKLSPRNSYQTISPSRSPLSSPGGGGVSPISLSPAHSPSGLLHSLPEELKVPALPPMASPWKPGRSALFRVWVPAREGVWLSDEELARAEQELFKSGIWNFLMKGDVVWDSALGPLMPGSNVGKLLFDGRFLRDLSYHYDQIGHLPSWINSFLFSPSYFHNIIHSSGNNPVVYLDILPFREQILSSLRLVQDHLETSSPQGRYRVAKWLYRATVTITGGRIISDEGLESVDEGWHGKLVIETDGTSEKARSLISRCAGPTADASTRSALLAAITTGGTTESIAELPKHSTVYDVNGERIETTSPWCILRERSRPGLIWIRPMESSDRIR